MFPFLTLSNIRYVSRVKWRNSGKGVAPSPTPQCSSYWKGSLLVALDYGRQLYLLMVDMPPNQTNNHGRNSIVYIILRVWMQLFSKRSKSLKFSLTWMVNVYILYKFCVNYKRHFLSYTHHHHHVVPSARISLTLSRYFSLSFIASGRSSGLHPVSSHSCCMYVWAGRPAFAWPYVEVHRNTSLMSSSLLLQQCPAGQVRLTCIVFVTGGRGPYTWCLVGCCHQDLFNIALILFWKNSSDLIHQSHI